MPFDMLMQIAAEEDVYHLFATTDSKYRLSGWINLVKKAIFKLVAERTNVLCLGMLLFPVILWIDISSAAE